MTAAQACFPKASRIKLASEIRSILRNGASVRACGIIIYYAKKDRTSRLAITLSKRVLKKAVDRNFVKRIVREYFRTRKNLFSSGYDVLVRFEENQNLLDKRHLRKTLESLFLRSGIIHG